MATVGGEDGAKAVADEGFAAVDGLDMAVEAAVACDEALEVAGFVEEGGEEVVVAGGEAIGGGAVGGVGEGLAEFAFVPRGGVDEPAEAVGVGVEVEGATCGGAVVAELGDLRFGELACGEICDPDVEVKWNYLLQE